MKIFLLSIAFFGLYGSLIVCNIANMLTLAPWCILLQGVSLATMDFCVHVLTHKDTLRPPMRTIAWVAVTTALAIYPGYMYGWQIAVLWFCQGWWDSSWHAADYHRPNGLPQAPSDYEWIRWAAPLTALTTVVVPIFLR